MADLCRGRVNGASLLLVVQARENVVGVATETFDQFAPSVEVQRLSLIGHLLMREFELPCV